MIVKWPGVSAPNSKTDEPVIIEVFFCQYFAYGGNLKAKTYTKNRWYKFNFSAKHSDKVKQLAKLLNDKFRN